MTTNEIAKKWNCKSRWVSDRCNEKMIPSASKIRGRWDIPEDAEKPPCSIKRATSILENIQESSLGNTVYLYSPSSQEIGEQVIRYLSREGFISKIDETEDINKAIQSIRITKRGIDLIAHAKRITPEEVKRQFKLAAEVNLGIINISAELNKQQEER